MPRTFVVVGASLAGAKAAETLRTEGFDGRVVLIGEEPVRPYERPPLSKAYLRGEVGFDAAAVHDEAYYEANDIELRLSTKVARIDPRGFYVETEEGERIPYDRLLLATGAEPRRLSVDGSELDGVLYLRSVADADRLRAAVSSSVPIVVIGAGWIGAEVAASARQLGADVSIVEVGKVPLERVLGAEVGSVYRDLHRDNGVKLHFGVGIESLVGEAGGAGGSGGSVEAVRLTDGTVIPAGVVVAGVGVVPRTTLAAAAGLDVENGILTDEHLETSSPGIFAAGDVANGVHPRYGRRVRLEHWSSALNQGPLAARNMLGRHIPYDRIPYFFSDQFDLGMEYRGFADGTDEVVVRGDVDNREFLAFWVREGRVAAAMNANVWDQGDNLEALVANAVVVDAAELADPLVDLAGIAKAG
ncbi:MAG TPA: FAD-dependent oxidoreductase [Acidimicrobiales bacterium]|nr:FAD-dependent oxidoreductase [Acidimicrobiales bacterium]